MLSQISSVLKNNDGELSLSYFSTWLFGLCVWKLLLQHLKDDRGEIELPDRLIREFAICLLPDVVAYCTSERGKREFAEWKKAQEAKKGKSEVDEKESKPG